MKAEALRGGAAARETAPRGGAAARETKGVCLALATMISRSETKEKNDEKEAKKGKPISDIPNDARRAAKLRSWRRATLDPTCCVAEAVCAGDSESVCLA